MSLGSRVGGVPTLDLPEEFGSSSSWQRAEQGEVTRNRLNRAEWMVRVGDGGLHRVVFALDDGHMQAECDCRGYEHREWCAHVAAMVLAYVRGVVEPADLSEPLSEEADRLWRERDDRVDAVTGGRR